MTRTILSLALLLFPLAACNEHPLVDTDYDHWYDTDGETDGDDGSEPQPDMGSGETDGDEGGDDGGDETDGDDSGESIGELADTEGEDEHYCGDGVQDRDEVCDDGDMNGVEGYCSEDCQMGPAK